MSQLTFQDTTVNDIGLHIMKTDKFKTTTIVIQLEQNLKKETVSQTALIPFVLKRGCSKFPTTQELRQYLDNLFGAVFYADVVKKGEKQIIQIQLEIANEKYLSDQSPLLRKGIEFLGEVLTKPRVEGNGFYPNFVKSEADSLKNKISSLVDDKIRYANQRVTEEMCTNEPYRLLAYGEINQLDHIDPVQLYTYYQKILSENPIDIYIVGDVDADEVKEEIQSSFSIQRRNVTQFPFDPLKKEIVKENVVIEKMKVGQGKLNIGLRTNTTLADDDYEALLVYNGILGGFPHSKLFVNVREKASLAYYAVSRLESQKGILMMMSGIEIDKFDQAVDIMKKQLDMLRNGEISDQELTQTKASLINQLLEINDNARTMIDFDYNGRLTGRNRKIEDMMKKIEAITKQDVIQMAEKVELDTIYFLRDEEGK